MTHSLNCAQVREQYTDFRDQSLNSTENVAVMAHLDACTPCQIFFKQLDHMLNQLKSLPSVTTSPDFTTRLLARTATAEHSGWHRLTQSQTFRMGSYAAAAGLTIALLFTQWMEPVQDGGLPSQITGTPQSNNSATPILAESADSSSALEDSLQLVDPAATINQQKLQLVNKSR